MYGLHCIYWLSHLVLDCPLLTITLKSGPYPNPAMPQCYIQAVAFPSVLSRHVLD